MNGYADVPVHCYRVLIRYLMLIVHYVDFRYLIHIE